MKLDNTKKFLDKKLVTIKAVLQIVKMIETCKDFQNGTTLKALCQSFPIFDDTLSGVTLFVILFGLVGNVLLFQTYWNKNLKLRFNVLMLTLAIYDFLFLIPRAIDQIIQLNDGVSMPDWGRFILNVFFNCGVYTSMFISLERFLLLYYEK